MKVMEREAFSYKKNDNRHIESIKYKDLEFLKCVGGPIIQAEVVQSYLKGMEDSKNKNKRLNMKVKYAKK